MADYDVVIVGAGIEGSATAYWCVKRGLQTLLLEQFALPHTRGSSHGACRVIRYSYAQRHYAQMMEEAFPLWTQLEDESKTKLYRKTGLLVFSSPPRDVFEQRMKQTVDLGKPVEVISHKERSRRYPAFKHTEDTFTYMDIEAGILKANKAIRCYQDVFVRQGGHLHDEEKVEEIIPGTMATVRTSRGEYMTRNVILTPGPWASKLLRPLGLEPPLMTLRINVMYWKEKTPGSYDNFPCFVDVGQGPQHVYGLPMGEYPGMMKIDFHSGIGPVDPDERDTVLGERQWDVEKVSQYVREHFPELHSQPAIVETCMYTTTPDNELILDRHPVYPNIIIGCGFSGHGFKLAPVVGKLLCQLVMGETPSHDISPCSLRRFKNSALLSSKM